MTNDDKTDIEEVSAAYQELGNENSPPELDARILQASKESLEESKPTKKPFSYQRYSIAASVCLSVLLASFYLNNPPLNPASIEAELKRSIEISQEADFNDTQDDDDNAQAFQLRAVPQAAESKSAGAVEELVIQAERREATSETTSISMEVLNEVEIGNLQLEELVILSDMSEVELDEFVYRNDLEDWLLEIEYLLEFDEASAQEEINLFTEAYPEIEVESALAELNE